MEVSNNIFDILKEELRKKELTIEVFCSNVLKISRPIFDRLKKFLMTSLLKIVMICIEHITLNLS